MDKLIEIMASKRADIAPRIRLVSDRELDQAAGRSNLRPSFRQALSHPERLAVISEIKRRSPSAGDIATGASAIDQADLYVRAHADARTKAGTVPLPSFPSDASPQHSTSPAIVRPQVECLPG